MANSPKAREYERLAKDAWEKAAALPEGAVRRYLESSAKHWEARARWAQERANYRAYLREHPEKRR